MLRITRLGFALSVLLLFSPACRQPISQEQHPEKGASAPGSEHGGGAVHWGYGEDDGPAVWDGLSADYELCASGRQQSPVDLTATAADAQGELAAVHEPARLSAVHQESGLNVVNNGHTIQVDHDKGSVLALGESSYELAQFHFHAPSEHTLDGKSYPMELHLVHQSSEGDLAVLGLLIGEGEHNPALESIWADLPDQAGEGSAHEQVTVHVDDLLPEHLDTYRYPGSLTTPPCSEGVSWLVALDPIELSAAQIGTFTAIFQGNNRPIQPLNDRSISVDPLVVDPAGD